MIRSSVVPDPDQPALLASGFLLGQQDSLVVVACDNDTRTDDLWLAIVESFEFLSDEESSPAAS